jgi:Alternate to MurJ
VPLSSIRTRRIAVWLALFNVLILVSRTSNSFQGPFLAKRIEQNQTHPGLHSLLADFRWLPFGEDEIGLAQRGIGGSFRLPRYGSGKSPPNGIP